MSGEVRCRKCGSTSIQAMKRGYTMTRGVFGMGDVITVCLKCGHKSEPGGTPWERLQDQQRNMSPGQQQFYAWFGGVAVLLMFIWFLGTCMKSQP